MRHVSPRDSHMVVNVKVGYKTTILPKQVSLHSLANKFSKLQ